MDLIGATGKIISLIETGIEVSDQLKAIANSEFKLPPNLVNLHNNAQQLLKIIETLPSIGIGSNPKIGPLADRAKKVSNKVIAIMDKINPKWRQKQETSLTLWRSYLKKKDMYSIEYDFKQLQEQMKFALLELVCQSNSEAKSQYEELRKRASLNDERVIGIGGSMNVLNQQLHAIQDSIYNLGKQIGSATFTESSFYGQATQVLIWEGKLSIILLRLTKDFQEKDLKANEVAKSDPGIFDWMTQGSNYRHKSPDNLNDKERLVYEECDPDMLKHHVEASDNFRSFLRGPSGAFLILGKPASGKSTLMKYLMSNSVVLDELEKWASKTGRSLIQAIFFFSVTQGSGALSSEESLYRSLLFQILRQCPALVDEVLPGEARLSPSIPLPSDTVQDAIKYIFSNRSNLADKYCFCLFIDGLDEYRSNYSETKRGKAQNNYDIGELAHHLVEWCQHEASNTKIVFSSRVIPALDDRFSAKEKILLHFLTKRDILQSAFSNFKRHPEAIPKNYVELSTAICDQAQGVFLWARLVIKDILEAYTDGVDPDTFQDRIKATPTDIADLYVKIMERVKEQDRQASVAILRLAAFQPAEFRLNTLACSWLDDLLNDANFPCNKPAKVYRYDEVNQHRKRAIQRLAALTHGILEAQDDNSYAADRIGPFFRSEIVFLHRTAQDFIRGLLMRDAKRASQDMLPWLQGTDNVGGDNWPQCWRTNLFVRIFHAEVRFGMLHADDYGKPHEDLWDFGFWAEDVSQLQLTGFEALSNFSSFSHHYRSYYTECDMGVVICNGDGYRIVRSRTKPPWRFSVQWAIFKGQDVSPWIQKRHVSRRLSCRIALSFAAVTLRSRSISLDGLKWLLRNKRVCATDKRPVWYVKDKEAIRTELVRAKEADQGHVDDDCCCGDFDAGPLQKHRKWVQIWLIFLHVFGNRAYAIATRTGQDDWFEKYCEMLELWLRYGAATDAIILMTPKREEGTAEFNVEKVSYIEVEQLLQVGRKSSNFQNLQLLLAKQHKSWVSWITDWILWAWTSWIISWAICAWAYHPQFPKDNDTVPIRKRYRQASSQELSLFDWEIYGVVSADDELVGDFWFQIT